MLLRLLFLMLRLLIGSVYAMLFELAHCFVMDVCFQ
jgi:hypothetical protein